MNIFDKIYRQARRNPKRIVLPEGDEGRVLEAVAFAVKEKLARIVLLGEKDLIVKKAKKVRLDTGKIEIIDPRQDEGLDACARAYWNLRKHRGITVQYARDLLLKNFVYYGAMMLREGRVDGFVAGAAHKTSDVVRAILHCIEKDSRYSTASGSFLVEVKDRRYGERGLFLFADCAVVPLPTTQQLVAIGMASCDVWAKITGYKGRLAMLSFSTRGSSSAPSVDRVRDAAEILKKTRPDLIIDGEMQVDSAVEPFVARIKVPDSPLAGRANILIFPSLDAGNIAYKLMQRLAGARVVGPIIQGVSRPCCDLSRGASPKEIIDAIAVTAVMAK
ncbi:MAG: phosphate acetyltransferase [Candidatus Omnitrophota bacterium]|nr:MAG: phosphate acetyltransferase [Candidatus Omnitrophota bacterium]